MHKFSGAPVIFEGNPYEEHTEQMHQLGAMAIAENGDTYRYTKAAATDFTAGHLLVSLGREANHQNVALSAAAAIGDKLVIPTMGATAVDANEYDEGWLIFNDNSPEGECYKINRHEANAGSLATDVYIEPALKTVATTGSEVELVRNPWNKPAISQLIAERPAGVAIQDWDVSVAEYGWLKTRGICSVLSDATGITVGYKATISNQTDGGVGLFSDVDGEPEVGWMMATGTATEFNAIYLTID
jgi:hypothetical protein